MIYEGEHSTRMDRYAIDTDLELITLLRMILLAQFAIFLEVAFLAVLWFVWT